MVGTYQLYANIDKDNIVEYEIDESIHGKAELFNKKGKLDKDRSMFFIDLLEKAKINKINELVDEKVILNMYTDAPTFSISTYKYGNAFWNEYNELEN